MGRRRRKPVRAAKVRAGNKGQASQEPIQPQQVAAEPRNILEIHPPKAFDVKPLGSLTPLRTETTIPGFTTARGNLALQIEAVADREPISETVSEFMPEPADVPAVEPDVEPSIEPVVTAPETPFDDGQPEVLDSVIRNLGTPNSEFVVSAIRELVANHAVDAEAAPDAPSASDLPAIEPDPIELPLVGRRDDRWAELRELPQDTAAQAEVTEFGDPTQDVTDGVAVEAYAPDSDPQIPVPASVPPVQRIAERDARKAQPVDPAQPEIVPPQHFRTDWDDPSRHEMSRSGKVVWNTGIFGILLAIPVLLFGTSPFSAKETAKHYLALGGCSVGNALALNPAAQGNPGYHAILDEDGDGLACEARKPSTTTTAGGSRFIRP